MKVNDAFKPNYPKGDKRPMWTDFVHKHYEDEDAELWTNSRFEVTKRVREIDAFGQKVKAVVLGIINYDQSAWHDWRDFQRIKNELLGPEWQAFEVFPPESQLIDPSNMYMLWCFEGPVFVGLAMHRLVLDAKDSIAPQRNLTEPNG